MGSRCDDDLDRLEAIYREGFRLLEEEDYQELAPLLRRRRTIISRLPRPLPIEEASEEKKQRIRELLEYEETFAQFLAIKKDQVQRALHQDALGRRKLQWYQREEE